MKISKLFHWLYGFLMCLPIFAVGITCLYVVFNPNAKDSYSDSYVQRMNRVDNTSLLVEGFTYSLSAIDESVNVATYRFNFTACDFDFNTYIPSTIGHNIVGFKIEVPITGNKFIRAFDDSGNMFENHSSSHAFITSKLPITFTLSSFEVWGGNPSTFMTYTLEQYVIVTNTIDNVFYHSVDVVNNSILFGWASNSFLNSPITYLTNLFGMPSDSPIITYLSYWLNISVIWLAFDLVMYVPLLAHRWIDKGIKE